MFESLSRNEVIAATAMPSPMASFVDEGIRRGRATGIFDFVPSNTDVLHSVLTPLMTEIPHGRFCEWGSGMGIGVGIAEMLGFRAVGIEINPTLVEASRMLLRDFNLKSDILEGDYMNFKCDADIYFTYLWPSQMRDVIARFDSMAADGLKFLFCNGAEDIQRWQKPC